MTIRDDFINLYLHDVAQSPDSYKASVRKNPREHAARVIDGLDRLDTKRMLNDLRAERRELHNHGYHLPKLEGVET